MIDYGGLSPSHLNMILRAGLKRYGLQTQGWHAVPFENGYEEMATEYVYEDGSDEDFPATNPDYSCKVLLSAPVEGLNFSTDFISLSDKIETEYQITTDQSMELRDKIQVTFPDGKTLRIRVTTPGEVFHAFTSVMFSYLGNVI